MVTVKAHYTGCNTIGQLFLYQEHDTAYYGSLILYTYIVLIIQSYF